MSVPEPTVRIFYESLGVDEGGADGILPLSALSDDCHVHGGLRIIIHRRLVPRLGFFGPDDVCFSTWLEELETVYTLFRAAETARYVFDEGEQGQPAFLFEREGKKMTLSIIASRISGGKADSDWQNVGFLYEDFNDQYLKMREAFLQRLVEAAPTTADAWIHWFLPSLSR